MSLRLRSSVTCWVTVLLFAMSSSVASDPDPDLGVQLDVTTQEELEPDLRACLAGQVEALDRVAVVPRGPVVLRVILMEQKATDGRSLGYLVYRAGHVRVPAEDEEAVVVRWESLRALPPDLDRACLETVADFRHEVLDDLPITSRRRPRIQLEPR